MITSSLSPKSLLALALALALALILVLGLGLFSGLSAQGGPADLTKTTWILEAWTREGTKTTVPANTITLVCKKRALSGQSAVNSYSGNYSATRRGQLKLKEISGTERAGSPELMKLEATYLALFGRMETYAVTRDKLTLTDGTAKNQLHFVASQPTPDKPLRGTGWTLTNIEIGDAKSVSTSTLVPNAPITLTISNEGKATGSGGVNRYFSTVQIREEGTVDFGSMGRTKKAGPPEAMKQENTYLAHLAEMKGFSIAGNKLTLSNRNGTKRLLFEAK